MSDTTFNEDFKTLLAEEFSMVGYGLDSFESMLLAYQKIMKTREPQAVMIHNALELIYDSLEN